MPICPSCDKEIHSLDARANSSVCYSMTVTLSGRIDYDDRTMQDDEDFYGFYCPECGDEIFHRETQAQKFLMGEANNNDTN